MNRYTMNRDVINVPDEKIKVEDVGILVSL